MSVLEKFLKYVKFPTTSESEKEDRASSEGQYVLAEELRKELSDLGLSDISISPYGIVRGILKGDLGETMSFLAHMDTSPSAKGEGVKARVIDNYDGKDIELSPGILLKPSVFPTLKNQVGHTLIVTDGTTLLGGDDKAGIAIIMQAIEDIIKNKIPHHTIEVMFTTDEEIGIGSHHIDVDGMISKYGYTVDGGSSKYINNANFNAVSLEVTVKGRSVHPGSAKNKMINAIKYAMDFDRSLPQYERPEYTEKKEGFFHLNEINGNEEETHLSYIIRDFSPELLEHRRYIVRKSAEEINRFLGYEAVSYEMNDSYYNMEQILDKNPEVIGRIVKAYETLGLPYEYEAIRGATDGSQLSYRGLPCPNLGTGDYNCHGRFEYVDLNEMNDMVRIVKTIMTSK